MKNKAQFILRLVASAGTSLLILAFIARLVTQGIPTADRPEIILILKSTALSFVALYLLFSLAQAFFRAWRYRILIAASENDTAPSLMHTYLVTLTRNMLVDLLPARIGELSYIALMNRGYNVSGKTCVSSLVISFVFDFIALLFIIAGVILHQIATTDIQGWLITALIGASILTIIMLAIIFFGIELASGIAKKILGRFAERPAFKKILTFTDETADAIKTTRKAGTMYKTLLLSIAVRITKYAGLIFMFKAVVEPSFQTFSNAPFVNIISSLLCAEGAASLPVPAFMSFGTYEAGGSLALMLLGFAKPESLAVMLSIHIWSQIIDYSLGGCGFIAFLFLSSKRNSSLPKERQNGILLPLLASLLLVSGLGMAALQHRKIGKLGSLTPPSSGSTLAVDTISKDKIAKSTENLNSFVVWSSNRHGNHDILMMTLPDRRISRLTRNPTAPGQHRVDYFPRISPNGEQIVFSRSQQPWVSQRNYIPWDVYILDIKSRKEQLLAKNGNTPTWSDDGKHVYFQRNGNELIDYNIETKKERTIYKTGNDDLSDNVMLETPSVSQKKQATAVTLRGDRGKRGTYIIRKDGDLDKVTGGCELVWAPDSSYLYLMNKEKENNLGNAIYKVNVKTLNQKVWLDLPGKFSHEYFPKVSNDGQYMVLGASTGAHEHDSADYEIFLWKINSPSKNVIRLTFHSGNDCWPDIYVNID